MYKGYRIIILILFLLGLNCAAQEKDTLKVTWEYPVVAKNYWFCLYSASDSADTTNLIPLVTERVEKHEAIFTQEIFPFQKYFYRGKIFYVNSEGDSIYSRCSEVVEFEKKNFTAPEAIKIQEVRGK